VLRATLVERPHLRLALPVVSRDPLVTHGSPLEGCGWIVGSLNSPLENKSDSMWFGRGPRRGAGCLANGKIIAGNTTDWKRPGDIVLQKRLISQQRPDSASGRAIQLGRRPGDALGALGHVTRETLGEIFRDPNREAVPDLFLWVGGDFECQDCLSMFNELEIGEVPIMGLIVEGVRKLGGRMTIATA
jgi:hypothetical protein